MTSAQVCHRVRAINEFVKSWKLNAWLNVFIYLKPDLSAVVSHFKSNKKMNIKDQTIIFLNILLDEPI